VTISFTDERFADDILSHTPFSYDTYQPLVFSVTDDVKSFVKNNTLSRTFRTYSLITGFTGIYLSSRLVDNSLLGLSFYSRLFLITGLLLIVWALGLNMAAGIVQNKNADSLGEAFSVKVSELRIFMSECYGAKISNHKARMLLLGRTASCKINGASYLFSLPVNKPTNKAF
jgi:hypothetical protein